ncbi:MAG TPA: sulfatase, partial [Planctomycetaceae bacterium]|nr:sulfatase [Planctomycetaceae bacterium]
MFNTHVPIDLAHANITRRWFFQDCGVGLATAALASLLANERACAATSATNPLAARQPHFAPKAKRVIYLFMAGA